MSEPLSEDLSAIARIDAVQNILEVVCRTTGLGFSAVARVTETRWIACAVRDEIKFGLVPGGELQIATTICNEIRESGQAVVIDHVSKDENFCGHPTPKMYGFESYISVPIRLPSGQFFGTLCAIDPKPAQLKNAKTVQMFELFADLIAMHLDSQQRVQESEAALLGEREASQLREQFIAVLGHDLRNPLAAISSGTDLMQMLPHDEDTGEILGMMKNSVRRMAELIDNILDFARGRLGGGLSLNRIADPKLPQVLDQVVTELRSAWPSRTIQYELAIDRPVFCDSGRIAQLLSNLLANALTHGDPLGPVQVQGRGDASGFALSVANTGKAIPAHILEQVFHPFSRGTLRAGQQGLGLGLYIASQIARAHGGALDVSSTDVETRFTFRMPADGRTLRSDVSREV